MRRDHERRIHDDTAFQAILDTEKAIKEARAKTAVSLVEQTRRAEHEQARREQRERENAIRVAHGLEPLPEDTDSDDDADESAALDGLDGAQEEDEEDDEEGFDVVLDEAGRILRDWITAQAGDDQRLVDAEHGNAPPLDAGTPTTGDAARVQ